MRSHIRWVLFKRIGMVLHECLRFFFRCAVIQLPSSSRQYGDIVKWIEAISKEEAASRPLDGFIKFDGKVYRIINSGEVVPNIKTIINKLKKVPSQYRMIPNDTMNIEADSFERELYIDLNERK